MRFKHLITSTLCILIFLNIGFAQSSFRYQAVARDEGGEVISNQNIGVQIGIMLDHADNPPVYQEYHQTLSNNYGVVNFNIGDGMPTVGAFETINWQQRAFVKIEMDMEGGTNYTVVSLSEILSVPRAIYAEKAGSVEGGKRGLYVTDFGAKGDGSTDDTEAFERALDSAFISGSKIIVPSGIYRLTSTLIIKDGISLIGEGMGSDPLQTPYNGSLLRYEGEGFAIKIIGHNVQLKDIVLRDQSNGKAEGGILLNAEGRLLESVLLSEILISGFTNGTALKLDAKNNGGITYATFQKVRVRHGKIGMHIIQDNSSFVNSNSFYHCQISGGAFHYGLLIDGGNNNIFDQLVIEPFESQQGHLIINKGEIIGHEIRIEGNNQPDNIPLIYFAENTKNSKLSGMYGGGLTLDKGNNQIKMRSGKAIQFKNSSSNKFTNATFFSSDGINLKDWEISGNGISTEIISPELLAGSNVLKLNIPAGTIANIEQTALARPIIKELALYDQVNFGFHVKTDQPGIAYTATNAPMGLTISTPHSGSGDWEFVGMNAQTNRNAQPIFRLEINNTSGAAIEVFVTTPALSFGNELPKLDVVPIRESGGILNGQLSHAFASAEIPANGFITLPKTANYFEITNTHTIYRINHLVSDRVPKGTVITLLFNHNGVGVTKSGYLLLKNGFTSVENGSLTLISNGNGTWREVDRNN